MPQGQKIQKGGGGDSATDKIISATFFPLYKNSSAPSEKKTPGHTSVNGYAFLFRMLSSLKKITKQM